MENAIISILREYLKYYPNEENNLKQLKDFISNNNDIYNKRNTIGHLTASGYIYAKEDKKILLLEHKKLNKLLQPGGHCETNDISLLEVAKREILEETGLKNLELINISTNKNVPIDINTHFIPENPTKDLPAHYHHDFRYLFSIPKCASIKIDTAESNDYKRIDIRELENNDNHKVVVQKIYNISR